jgi:hypothetical protein
MDDFPIWLKGIVWLVLGSTVIYVAAQLLLGFLN